MYRRLIIVSAIIFTAFAAFSILGFHSISLQAEGLEGKRIVEFSEVAEQIRVDVNQKLNKFIQTEQKRPYTDYQYFYAPETANNGFNFGDNMILRSPLAESMSHGMAYGHFQIEPNGKIITPFYAAGLNEKLDSEKQLYLSNLNENIANSLKDNANVKVFLDIKRKALARKTPEKSFSRITDRIKSRTSGVAKSVSQKKSAPKGQQLTKNGRANYNVDTFQEEGNQKSQIITQSRNTVIANQLSNSFQGSEGAIHVQTEQGSQQEVAADVIANNQSQNGTYYWQAGSQTPDHNRGIIETPKKPAAPRPRASQSPRQIPTAEPAKPRKEDAPRDPAAPAIIKSMDDAKVYSMSKQATKLESEAKRFKNITADKDKDAYDESQTQADGKPSSTPQKELETLEERDTSDSFGSVNDPAIQGVSVTAYNPVLVRQNAKPSGSDIALGLKKDQKLLLADRAASQTKKITIDADMDMSQTWKASPITIPEDTPESQRPKIFAGQSGYGYDYEQTLQTALHNVPAVPSDQQQADDMVQIRIEPFYPITVNSVDQKDSYFGSQVFLLRHVQIEDSHFLQGFRLNEKELIAELKQSASQMLRNGMGFELSKKESPDAAYAAVLDFDFGQIVLNLMELKPHWIADQVSNLKNWYFAIVTVVLVATILALLSLWRNLNAQVKLARKKDDFISAVSHELRTPLTTIRMYTEMLEKNWVKTDDKRTEYYTTMRHESERLTRLIENVLDFSRIQRGKKRYNFALGDINSCIREVVELMRPCAAKQDFKIVTDLSSDIQSTSFDSDAVMQIVINLVDNALKYAANATDKTVTVRTRTDGKYILIEVADHGPGIPHTQRKKIFDEFYRIAEESKRETTGTGLGLALVKRFADAHNGFVEAISAKPNGALLRVAIAIKN